MSFNGDLYSTGGADVVMTTSGDMVKYESGARARLPIGTANQILQTKSSLPSWETVDLADTVLTTAGDVLYEDATPALARLPAGSLNDVLTMGATVPAWSAPAGGGAWTKMGSTTLTGTATTMSVTWALADIKDYLNIYVWTGNGGGVIRRYMSFYDSAGVVDHGSNYSTQFSTNYGASTASINNIGIIGYDNSSEFDTIRVSCPNAGDIKLAIRESCLATSTSAGTAESNRMNFGKWADTTNEVRGVEIWDGGAGGSFAIGSSMIVFGCDL